MGGGVALLSLIGLWQTSWLLEHTRKGAWLRERAGDSRAAWILRGLFLCAVLFGVLLALNVIRPVQW